MNNTPPELLAPAGTPDAAWAALAYGADAVYAGLSRFSARAEAGNFTVEQLDELIGYAHHLNRRVYVPFNTLVQQDELQDALEVLAILHDLHADGVIVQDMGVVRLAKKNFPALRLHASTQMAVHNLAGAQYLAGLGFKRVVLARELSLKEIATISTQCGIETETFIHGALCYSYSGLCLFSSHVTGRSGNRGRCAYLCRQSFACGAEKSLPFSMKDFSAAEHLSELVSAGVASLKIEGRMKGPLYVAAVTDFYRKALAGDTADLEQRLADIRTIFGRPSTDFYLKDPSTRPVDPLNEGHRGAQIGTVKAVKGSWLIFHSQRALQKHDGLKMEGSYGFAADELRLASDPEHKRRFDLPANIDVAVKLPPDAPVLLPGTVIYCSYSQAVRQRYEFSAPRPGQFRQRRAVDIQIIQTLENVMLIASAGEVRTELSLSGPFEMARQPEKALGAVRQCFEKLGETDWKLGELTTEGPAVFVPVSVLNDARRRLIAEFSDNWKTHGRARPVIPPASEVMDLGYNGTPLFWSVKSRRFQPLDGIDEFVLELDLNHPEEVEKALAFYADRLRLALPMILREEDVGAFKAWLNRLPQQVKWEAANIGGLQLLNDRCDRIADWSLYTLNAQAARQWREQGIQRFVLSPEDDADNGFALLAELGDAAIVPVYQHTPLMISSTKPESDGDELTDRAKRTFHVESVGREYVFTQETPFSLVNRLDELKAHGARRFRIDLNYGMPSMESAADLVRRILAGDPVPGHAGNFDRGIQ